MSVVRFPGSVARYTMIKHDRDRRNPYNSYRYSGTATPKQDSIYNIVPVYTFGRILEIPQQFKD